MSLDTIIDGAVGVQKTVPGIRDAYSNAPESLNILPCFVTYLDNFTVERDGPNLRTVKYQIKMQLLVNRGGDLPGADATLKPFLKNVISTFDQNISLQGTAWDSTINAGKYGAVEYAGTSYLGIDFTLEALEKESVVYKP